MYFNNDPVKIDHKVQNVTQCDPICCFIHSEKVLCKVKYIFKFNVSWYINPCSPRYSLIYDSSGCPVIFTPFYLRNYFGKTFLMIFPMVELLHVSTALQIACNDNWFSCAGSIFSCSLQMKLSTSSTMAGTNRGLLAKRCYLIFFMILRFCHYGIGNMV